jgi:predicted RNA-binding Zn ribbon-like protein
MSHARNPLVAAAQARPLPESRPQPPPPYVFDLDGGRVCVDFANTRGSSSASDHLNDYADLVAFAAQSDLITPRDAEWLRAEARRDPVSANAVLTRAKRLREALRAIFVSLAAGADLPEADLDAFNFDLAASLAHARVVPTHAGDGYQWGWTGRNLDAPLWPITRSAADLLTSDAERARVRECGADDCVWLFMDTTRNRSRQWCSMQSCGNREKARRHYQRVRERRSTPPDADAPHARTPARRTPATASGDATATAD